MSILIDGYNLLFTIGLPRGASGPGTLENARRSLLEFLADHLHPGEIATTTVIFDAKRSSRRGDSQFRHRGITVQFAQEQDEADELLELLIAGCPTPGKLLVVSSDRRIQTAASRRNAMTIGSESWLEWLRSRATARPMATGDDPHEDRRQRAPNRDEIQAWLDEFGDVNELAESDSIEETENANGIVPRADDASDSDEPEATDHGWGPFPPGYGEDLT